MATRGKMWEPTVATTPQAACVGIARIPFVRQRRTYDCGPTCMRMACDLLEFHRGLSLDVITSMAGATPASGTTEIEMAKGLDALGLAWERPIATSTAELRATLAGGGVVFLRTLLPGGFKHWVLVHGWQGDDFLVTCPSRGRQTWTDAFLATAWSARDYDHFVISSQRADHPVLAHEQAEAMALWRPVHAQSLSEFLGDHPVIPPNKLTAWHHRAIRDAATAIQAMPKHPGRRRLDYAAAPGVVFYAVPRDGCTDNMVAVEEASGNAVGGIHEGLRWVSPAFRGRGLGIELVLAAYAEPGQSFLAPTSYSEGGYASRVAAWRLAVARAKSIESIPPPIAP